MTPPSGAAEKTPASRIDAARSNVGIIVNAKRHVVSGTSIDHAEVVRLAFPSTGSASFAVTFRGGAVEQPTGFLVPGQRIQLAEDQVFHVAAAVQS